ncbi:MAG TPA: ABC transporter substrate-binding protein [Acidimicrobiales bacterium]|nr:ABC transporter substrate-binding protein [Acidimicrobiales bacterium]
MSRLRRFDPATGSALMTLAVVVVVGLLLSLGTIFPPGGRLATSAADGDTPGEVAGTDGGGGAGGTADSAAGGGGGGGAAAGGGGGTGPGAVAAKPGQACEAGRNGGNTDVGVTGNRVKLAATIVNDGPGASFLAPVRIGMNAVVNRVNGAGGVCGRQLELRLRNDSWNATLGAQYIQNFVESEKVFALSVVPSSEGLRSADDYIERQKVPVVGTDGMLIHQYRNPWIWPVATSTISAMHIMAKNAADRGAKEFGIVFDSQYHFGVEGAYAYNQAVKRLVNKDVDGYDPSLKTCTRRFCGIQPNKTSYTSEARDFNSACGMNSTTNAGGRCDFVAILLEPDTALSWFAAGRGANPGIGFGGAQPLFTRDFAEKCRSSCKGMWVWTGYNPPIEQYAGAGPVSEYVAAVRKESSSADVTNQFLEGGYVGMGLLVEALKKVGPNLTRDNLRTVLDSMTYNSGLSAPLTWKPGNHFANSSAQAFEIQYEQSFTGWRSRTPLIPDPWVGQDIPPGE